MEDEKQDLRWRLFWARIFAGLGLASLGVFAGEMLLQGAVSVRWGGAGVLAVALTAFFFMLVHYPRGDELDRTIDRVTSVHAGLATIGLIIFQTLFARLGWFSDEPLSVFVMPGFFILYKTMIAQHLRAALASGKPVASLDALRA